MAGQLTGERLDRLAGRIDGLGGLLGEFEGKIDDTNARVRSIEESIAEVKDLLVEGLGRG